MKNARFDWDDAKDIENQRKHHVAFSLAQQPSWTPNVSFYETLGTATLKNGITASGKLVKAS